MKVEFNKVTWYSKVLAIIVYISTLFLGFWLGQRYEKLNCVVNEYEKQLEIINTAVFACPDNKAIYAKFTERMVAIKLSDGRELTLPQTISASGARYANSGETFVFWNKGNGAFIEENGTTTYQDCVTK
jgi:membrane-bound inhibitor of C-type lysozyme